jgi:hypothetical protein
MSVRQAMGLGGQAVSLNKAQLLDTLRGLLRDSFRLRYEGTAHAKLTQAQGYADGYMRMLLDSGLCTQAELLTLVGEVRRGVDGPAVARVAMDADGAVAA